MEEKDLEFLKKLASLKVSGIIDDDELQKRKDEYFRIKEEELKQKRIKEESEKKLAEEKRKRHYEEECKRKIERQKQRKEALKILTITFFIGIIILSAGILLKQVVLPSIKYNDAKELYENKEYKQAYSEFQSLGDFKNSEDLALKSNYLYAVTLFKLQQYYDAEEIFNTIYDSDNYQDTCIEYISYCEGITNLDCDDIGKSYYYFSKIRNKFDVEDQIKNDIYLSELDAIISISPSWEDDGGYNHFIFRDGVLEIWGKASTGTPYLRDKQEITDKDGCLYTEGVDDIVFKLSNNQLYLPSAWREDVEKQISDIENEIDSCDVLYPVY